MMPEVANAVWLPAVHDAIRSVVVEPLGGGVQVTLRLAGPANVLAADVIEQSVRPRVVEMWNRMPHRAADLCRAVADATAGLESLEAQLRRAELDASMLLDTGKEADEPLARAIDLRHRVQVKREGIKGLRQRAEEAIRQAGRDLRHLCGLARVEVLAEAEEKARAAWARLAEALAGPLEELLAARVAWSAVVGHGAGLEARLEDLVPQLPPAPAEERHVHVPEQMRSRHGFYDPRLGAFVESDTPPILPQETPARPSEAEVARIAASLNYTSVEGHLDERDRFVLGPPPGPGERSKPLTPAFDNIRFDEAEPAPPVQTPEENEAAKQMAEQWRREAEAKRMAEQMLEEATLPVPPALPEEPPLPTADPLPQPPVVLEPPPVLPGDEGPPRRKARR
jgi:hypothetical protein